MKSHHHHQIVITWILILQSFLWTISQAYVTTNQHKWLSIPAEFGKSMDNKQVMANLFFPPRDLDPELCTMYTLGDDDDDEEDNENDEYGPQDLPTEDDLDGGDRIRHLYVRRRRMESTLGFEGQFPLEENEGYLRKRFAKGEELSNMISHQNRLDRSKDPLPIALLVERGTCAFSTKALNALKLNELWKNQGGPRIQYLIITNYCNGTRDSPMEMHTDNKDPDLEKIGVVSLGCSSGWYIAQAMSSMQYNNMSGPQDDNVRTEPYSMYLDPQSFFSSDKEEYRNKWRYPVLIDGIYLYADVAKRSQRITIVFLVIALAIPLIRAVSVFFMLNRDFRFRRNQRGFITGISWSRRAVPAAQPSIRDSVLSIWTAHEKSTLTEEEVKKLPLIQFGITELGETIKTYKHEEDKLKEVDGEDDIGDEQEGREIDAHNGTDGTNIVSTISENQDVRADGESTRSEIQDDEPQDGQSIRVSVIEDMNRDEESIRSEIGNEAQDEDSIRDDIQANAQNGETARSDDQARSQNEEQPLMVTVPTNEGSRPSQTPSHDMTPPSPSKPEEFLVMDRMISQSFINDAYTSCFSCSVCLCDFDHGEEVRLLPKCGHYFHDECIMPWLIEKKGSCPLCQTDVLDRGEGEE